MERNVISRQGFVRGLAGVAAFSSVPAALFAGGKAEAPVMRVGIMTDTHILDTEASCARVESAYGLFRDKRVDLVVHLGDVADNYCPAGYKFYRKVFNGVYSGATKPGELFVYAGHDLIGCAGMGAGIDHNRLQWSYDLFRKALDVPNKPADIVDYRGYKFVIVPEYINGRTHTLDYKEYERMVAEACAATPGKPVFVLDHEPPRGTVYNSYNWGRAKSAEIFKRYPQVVSLSGHVHGSLRHDLNIWQGEYTAINAGCLQYWGGLCAASAPEAKPAFGVLVMEVYSDRLEVRRWDVRDRSEIDSPWTVSLPFAAGAAPYAPHSRKAAAPVPGFAADAELSATAQGNPFTGFKLEFPQAPHAFHYRIEVQNRAEHGGWKTFSWLEIYSEFWKHPKDRTGRADFVYLESYFEPLTEYRFAVSPVNQYGVIGRPIFTVVKSPANFAKRTLLYEVKDPVKDIVFYRKGWDGRKTRHAPGPNGFYGPMKTDRNFIELPAGLFKGEPKTRFRLTLDMRTVQPEEGEVWDLKFQDPTTERHCTGRTSTPYGDSGNERYVLELTKWNLTMADTYHVCFSWSSPGCVRFNGLKLERL